MSVDANAQRACPFCDQPTDETWCPSCRRETTSPRRPCKACKKMTPSAESRCCRCGATQGNEMLWKIPLIVGLFVMAFVLSIFLNMI